MPDIEKIIIAVRLGLSGDWDVLLDPDNPHVIHLRQADDKSRYTLTLNKVHPAGKSAS